MKTIYIAARAKYRTDEVAKIQEVFQTMDYRVTYDWPAKNGAVKKPYRNLQNRKYNKPAQEKMLKAASEADVFILLDSEGLRGAYIEFGAFLRSCIDNSAGRRAYIVGPNSNERQSIFESPDYIFFARDIEDVYRDLAGFNSS